MSRCSRGLSTVTVEKCPLLRHRLKRKTKQNKKNKIRTKKKKNAPLPAFLSSFDRINLATDGRSFSTKIPTHSSKTFIVEPSTFLFHDIAFIERRLMVY